MKTHIVAIFDKSSGENTLHLILDEDEVSAVKKALIKDCNPKYLTDDYKKWVEELGSTLEDVIPNAAEADLVISNVLTI